MLAAVQLQSGHLNAAAETAVVGLTLAPDDIDCLMLSAEIHQQRGDPDRSLVPLRRVLALTAASPLAKGGIGGVVPRALALFADASRQTHQADQAIDFIGRLSPEAQRPVAETLLLAQLFESQGDIARADALFSRALDDDEHSPQTIREYIVFQARRGAFDQVYALASQYRTEHPDDIETLAVAAELLGSQSPDPDLRLRGLEWLDDIAANHPDHAADARYRSGLCRLQRGDLVEAETMLLRASQLAPENPKPVNALAWLYGEELGRPKQGLTTIEKFLAVGGRPTPEMLDTHGTLLLRLKRFNEAREKLSACLATIGQSPTRTAATYHLGLVLLESGANSDGLTNIRLALEVNDRLGGLGKKEIQEAHRLLGQSTPARP
jgi:tetratricopeptide (TPR) repeat protein